MAEYTDEQIQQLIEDEKVKWEEEILKPIQEQIPKKPTEEEIANKQKENELFQREKNIILREHGLGEFSEYFHVEKIEDMDSAIQKFQNILKSKKIENSFVPDDHKSTDEYSSFQKKGNVQGMIQNKISKLFQ